MLRLGEFVEDQEPTHVGADLVAGSLIKNPGGTMAPTGGYVVGKARYVSAAFKRLSAPGVEGGEFLWKVSELAMGFCSRKPLTCFLNVNIECIFIYLIIWDIMRWDEVESGVPIFLMVR